MGLYCFCSSKAGVCVCLCVLHVCEGAGMSSPIHYTGNGFHTGSYVFLFLSVFIVWDKIFHWTGSLAFGLGWLGPEGSLDPPVFLSVPQCWSYRHKQPCPASEVWWESLSQVERHWNLCFNFSCVLMDTPHGALHTHIHHACTYTRTSPSTMFAKQVLFWDISLASIFQGLNF